MFNYHELDVEKCEFVSVGLIEELPPGERLFLEIDEMPIVVFNIAGQIFAIADICSHDENQLGDGELDGFEVMCSRHGARFDIRNGKSVSLPAIVDIPAYPIREIDGQIEIGLPLKE